MKLLFKFDAPLPYEHLSFLAGLICWLLLLVSQSIKQYGQSLRSIARVNQLPSTITGNYSTFGMVSQYSQSIKHLRYSCHSSS
uniref:Uncharacterized protein n=1 Tax=Picea glauca TaxID=3330 RepID=A0A117NHI6_PICGL|nr:hypothetical protein ABT39_MTgene4458 [Picea glauca]QHR91341.1 hypothetical protein Q903MT_gene5373 [Picea sitchensis]